MEDIDDLYESNGVDRAISIAVVVGHDLQDARTAESLQGFGLHVLLTLLGSVKRKTHVVLNALWELPKILAA